MIVGERVVIFKDGQPVLAVTGRPEVARYIGALPNGDVIVQLKHESPSVRVLEGVTLQRAESASA